MPKEADIALQTMTEFSHFRHSNVLYAKYVPTTWNLILLRLIQSRISPQAIVPTALRAKSMKNVALKNASDTQDTGAA